MKSNKILITLFLIAPFAVFFDVLFLDYTVAFSDAAADVASRFGELLPVADPSAGSLQDHPWLFKIANSLRFGSIPLINLDNGLGSPLLESMQSGVLYPLNILLIFMNLSTSNFFDLFSILHVLILATNSFILFNLYSERRVALIASTAMALSPLTFIHINMVHYRAFVWMPLIVWGSLSIARRRYSKTVFLVLVFSIFCSITAGNPQETFFGILISCILFVFEFLLNKGKKLKPILLFSVLVLAGISISIPALLPYITSQSQGLLASVGTDISRSAALIRGPWLLGAFIPYINGAYPDFYRVPQPSHDEMAIGFIHPIFTILLIAGLLTLIHKNRLILRSGKIFFSACFILITIAILNISEFSPFTIIIARLPFLNAVRMTKYTNYIYLLIGLCSCISLQWLMNSPAKLRQHTLLYSIIIFILLILLILVFQIQDDSWNLTFAHIRSIAVIWIGFTITFSIFFWLLWVQESLNLKACMSLLIVGTILMRPYGFPKERSSYPPFDQASNSPIELFNERILSTEPANANILRGYESVSFFDPIHNVSIANLMNANFQIIDPNFLIQPVANSEITEQQINLLQLMGVTLISNYRVQDNIASKTLAPNLVRLINPLPRIFLIQEKALGEIQKHCAEKEYSKALDLIQASTLAKPRIYRKKINRIHFSLDASGQGILVALQAFTPAWKFHHVSADSFCNGFSSWRGSFQEGREYEIEYVPPGLRISFYGVLGGILLLILTFGLKKYLP